MLCSCKVSAFVHTKALSSSCASRVRVILDAEPLRRVCITCGCCTLSCMVHAEGLTEALQRGAKNLAGPWTPPKE